MDRSAAELLDAFVAAAREQFANDRDTIGELAGAVNQHASRLAMLEDQADVIADELERVAKRTVGELRDELHELELRVQSLARTLNARTERAA